MQQVQKDSKERLRLWSWWQSFNRWNSCISRFVVHPVGC